MARLLSGGLAVYIFSYTSEMRDTVVRLAGLNGDLTWFGPGRAIRGSGAADCVVCDGVSDEVYYDGVLPMLSSPKVTLYVVNR